MKDILAELEEGIVKKRLNSHWQDTWWVTLLTAHSSYEPNDTYLKGCLFLLHHRNNNKKNGFTFVTGWNPFPKACSDLGIDKGYLVVQDRQRVASSQGFLMNEWMNEWGN